MYVQPLGQLSLRDALSDARRNQEMREPPQVVEVVKLAALEAFLAFYLFLQLKVKRLYWVNDPLDLLVFETGPFQPCPFSTTDCCHFPKTRPAGCLCFR
jgi:hypothetical protein